MQIGVTGALPGQTPLRPQELLDIRDLIAAYTINDARALGCRLEIGSLAVGTSADFILLDQHIMARADHGEAMRIGKTQVLETRFCGRRVYSASKTRSSSDQRWLPGS